MSDQKSFDVVRKMIDSVKSLEPKPRVCLVNARTFEMLNRKETVCDIPVKVCRYVEDNQAIILDADYYDPLVKSWASAFEK